MAVQQVVVDASVIVKWLRIENEINIQQANLIFTHLQQDRMQLYAPELAKYEVGNVLSKRKLSTLHAANSLEFLYQIQLHFVVETLKRAKKTYQISQIYGLTYYDAAYVSLAEELGALLITENIKHLGKVKTVNVVPLSAYK